jgi:hypothetical protein
VASTRALFVSLGVWVGERQSGPIDGRQVGDEAFDLALPAVFRAVRGGEAGFDQKEVPNNLLPNEPSLSTQGTGGNCGS